MHREGLRKHLKKKRGTPVGMISLLVGQYSRTESVSKFPENTGVRLGCILGFNAFSTGVD